MDRVQQLRRFGHVPPWLENRILMFTPTQWRLFFDPIADGMHKIPLRIEDTMPKSADGTICSPALEPSWRQLQAIREWVEWGKIWGERTWGRTKKKPAEQSNADAEPKRQARLLRDH